MTAPETPPPAPTLEEAARAALEFLQRPSGPRGEESLALRLATEGVPGGIRVKRLLTEALAAPQAEANRQLVRALATAHGTLDAIADAVRAALAQKAPPPYHALLAALRRVAELAKP